MAIHPLDITPENEAEAAAERAELRRSRSMGGFLWFAWMMGAGGLALAFVAACLLASGPGPLEILGDLLHNLAKLSLLASLFLLFVGYRAKSSSAERFVEAEIVANGRVDPWRVDNVFSGDWNHSQGELPTSRPAWTPPPKSQSSPNPVRSLLDSLPPAPQSLGSPKREGSGP